MAQQNMNFKSLSEDTTFYSDDSFVQTPPKVMQPNLNKKIILKQEKYKLLKPNFSIESETGEDPRPLDILKSKVAYLMKNLKALKYLQRYYLTYWSNISKNNYNDFTHMSPSRTYSTQSTPQKNILNIEAQETVGIIVRSPTQSSLANLSIQIDLVCFIPNKRTLEKKHIFENLKRKYKRKVKNMFSTVALRIFIKKKEKFIEFSNILLKSGYKVKKITTKSVKKPMSLKMIKKTFYKFLYIQFNKFSLNSRSSKNKLLTKSMSLKVIKRTFYKFLSIQLNKFCFNSRSSKDKSMKLKRVFSIISKLREKRISDSFRDMMVSTVNQDIKRIIKKNLSNNSIFLLDFCINKWIFIFKESNMRLNIKKISHFYQFKIIMSKIILKQAKKIFDCIAKNRKKILLRAFRVSSEKIYHRKHKFFTKFKNIIFRSKNLYDKKFFILGLLSVFIIFLTISKKEFKDWFKL